MKIILILIVISLMHGCQKSTSEKTSKTNNKITIHILKDGTKCAVYHRYRAGGMSCDWSNK